MVSFTMYSFPSLNPMAVKKGMVLYHMCTVKLDGTMYSCIYCIVLHDYYSLNMLLEAHVRAYYAPCVLIMPTPIAKLQARALGRASKAS